MADRMVQGQLLARTALHWGIFLLFTGCLTVGVGVLIGDPKLGLTEVAYNSLQSLLWPAVTLAALLPAFLVDTLRLSSKFVGPMVRLRRSMQNLGYLGTADRLTFREGDFWQQSADDFNAVLDLVQSQKTEIERLEQQIASLQGNEEVDAAMEEAEPSVSGK